MDTSTREKITINILLAIGYNLIAIFIPLTIISNNILNIVLLVVLILYFTSIFLYSVINKKTTDVLVKKHKKLEYIIEALIILFFVAMVVLFKAENNTTTNILNLVFSTITSALSITLLALNIFKTNHKLPFYSRLKS